jgi:prepilin-type N-terminal cleavage/methylation domain-containing protein
MRARIVKRLRDRRGFTLVELVVAMPIMLVVMGGLVLLLTTVMHWGSQTQEETTLQTEARSAMNRLETEIRGAFIGQANSVPFSAATATSMTFDTPDEAAANSSTGASFHLLQVSYRVSNGTLQRQFQATSNTYPGSLGPTGWTWGSLSPWATVVGSSSSITNSDVFTYYTNPVSGGSAPALLSFPVTNYQAIVAVGVKLKLSTGGSQPETYTVNDLIAVRGDT